MFVWLVGLIITFILAAAIKELRRKNIAGVVAAKIAFENRQKELINANEELRITELKWSLAFDCFTAVDIETTGLARAKSRIIQIAIVTFIGGRVARVWTTYLNPGVGIPENATKVNNITNAMVASAPVFGEIAHDIRLRLDSSPLVAHNLKFDTDFLIEEFARQKITWLPLYGHCTMRQTSGAPTPDPPREERTFYSKRERRYVTYRVRTEQPWLKLTDAMASHGIRAIGPLHDAVNDAIGSGEVFVARGMAAIKEANGAVIKATEELKFATDFLNKAHELRGRWPI